MTDNQYEALLNLLLKNAVDALNDESVSEKTPVLAERKKKENLLLALNEFFEMSDKILDVSLNENHKELFFNKVYELYYGGNTKDSIGAGEFIFAMELLGAKKTRVIEAISVWSENSCFKRMQTELKKDYKKIINQPYIKTMGESLIEKSFITINAYRIRCFIEKFDAPFPDYSEYEYHLFLRLHADVAQKTTEVIRSQKM